MSDERALLLSLFDEIVDGAIGALTTIAPEWLDDPHVRELVSLRDRLRRISAPDDDLLTTARAVLVRCASVGMLELMRGSESVS